MVFSITRQNVATSDQAGSDDDVEGGLLTNPPSSVSSSSTSSPPISSLGQPQHDGGNQYLLPTPGINLDNPLFNSSLRKRPSNLRDNLPLPCINSDWIGVGGCGQSSRRGSYSPFKQNQYPGGGMRCNMVLSLLTFIAFGGTLIYAGLSAHVSSLEEELRVADTTKDDLLTAHSNIVHELVVANNSILGMKRTYDSLKEANHRMSDAMRQFQGDHHAGAEDREKFAFKLKEVEVQMSSKIEEKEGRARMAEGREEALKKNVQGAARREVEALFGAGPHRVELELEIPVAPADGAVQDSSVALTMTRTIEIVMAPLDVMPHSVHTFLMQVDRKVWNGAKFDLHAGHVLQAHPEEGDEAVPGRSGAGAVRSLLFQEFSHKYPHAKYSIGFHGASLGGAMFINMDNNHHHHRPDRGDNNEELPDTGEPCFANVVGGRDVIDAMDEMKVGADKIFEQPVIIKRARIIMPLSGTE